MRSFLISLLVLTATGLAACSDKAEDSHAAGQAETPADMPMDAAQRDAAAALEAAAAAEPVAVEAGSASLSAPATSASASASAAAH